MPEDLKVLDFDSTSESAFFIKVKRLVDGLTDVAGVTILFDWDGTIRGNFLEKGIKDYVRKGFIDSYNYCRSKGISIGLCTARFSDEIPNLSPLGVKFDATFGSDGMQNFINLNPSRFHDAAAKLINLPKEEFTRHSLSVIEQIQKRNYPDGWENTFQAVAEFTRTTKISNNLKLLFLAHRLANGYKDFLIDDSEDTGKIVELFKLGVQIPKPAGYIYDFA